MADLVLSSAARLTKPFATPVSTAGMEPAAPQGRESGSSPLPGRAPGAAAQSPAADGSPDAERDAAARNARYQAFPG